MSRVLIVEKRMTHYRVPLYEKLRSRLADQGIELLVGHGPPHASELSRHDGGALAWATAVPTRYLLGGRLCLQSFGAVAKTCDLLVVTQENKLVSNLWHQFAPTRYKVALWGHGANLQGHPHSVAERWKRRVSRRADWWFAYTRHTLPLLEKAGFDMARVTVVGNSIDTSTLEQWCRESEAEGVATIRTRLGLAPAAFVGLYLGSFYAEKRLDLLFDAALEIRSRVPGFALIVAGSGPELPQVEAFARRHAWCHLVGQVRGRQKSDVLVAGDVILNPGAVGLGIQDGFAAGRPMVTTAGALHGPEIAYLENGVNGAMTGSQVADFVTAVCRLHEQPERHAQMSQQARRSAKTYSLDAMVEQFTDGIQRALDATP